MLISPSEVVTGALVNAIAVMGRQIGKAAAELREPGEDLVTARWFETFRLTADAPELPDLSQAAWDRIAGVLGGDDIQAALQELLAARLTDAPESDASRAREAVRVALGAAHPGAGELGGEMADYYDDQICALVARLQAEEPPILAQIRSEAFSSRMISILHAIERSTAARAGKYVTSVSGSQGVQVGDHNTQVICFIGEHPGLLRTAGPTGGAPAGRLLAEVTDPFALEVHRPVQMDDPHPGLPVLPAYVLRDHDRQLTEIVRSAVGGTSGIAVLVAGSSTGKTRAFWEALGLLRDQPERWRLWHPIDPARPEATLRELPSVGPRTVIWLNEAQLYLDVAEGGLGERIAAGLRELLRNPARAPVLLLATLWPQYWDVLTGRPASGVDLHAQARELLAGRDISVPAAFTDTEMEQFPVTEDPRLSRAVKAAEGGQVIQFLAGAPELMARYRNAPPAAAALIATAIDARRMGMAIALRLDFLKAAAPGYLTDTEWDGLGEDWLEEALAYATAPCKGIRGTLALIRGRKNDPARGLTYRLADYVEQHGRRARRSHFPPPDFWEAAGCFASPVELAALAGAAGDRGLLRDAARLRKYAAAQGNTAEAVALIRHWPHSADPNPAQWAATHAALDDQAAVAQLLETLEEAGATDQASIFLARIADHVGLDKSETLARLRRTRRDASKAWAADTELESDAVDFVRDFIQRSYEAERAAALADPDPAAHAILEHAENVALRLGVLQETGATEQIAALLTRDPAAHASLHELPPVILLLRAMGMVGAREQAAALAKRIAARIASVSLDYPGDLAELLDAIREAGATEQARRLVDQLPAKGRFDVFSRQSDHQTRYRFGREPDGSPSPSWDWADLD